MVGSCLPVDQQRTEGGKSGHVKVSRRDINQSEDSAETTSVGDMSAHIEDWDGYTDHNYYLVLDLCE